MATSSAVMVRGELVNAALDEIQQARAQVMARPVSMECCGQLAELAEVEAAWWEVVSEGSRTRVSWRAALSAREHAQSTARYWRGRAAAQQVSEPVAHPLPGTGVA